MQGSVPQPVRHKGAGPKREGAVRARSCLVLALAALLALCAAPPAPEGQGIGGIGLVLRHAPEDTG